MAWILATTEQQKRWYLYDINTPNAGEYQLLEQRDLNRLPLWPDKQAAKEAALALGLKTWRYVRI